MKRDDLDTQLQDAYNRLLAENAALNAELKKYKAYWDHARLADRDQWEKYEWMIKFSCGLIIGLHLGVIYCRVC